MSTYLKHHDNGRLRCQGTGKDGLQCRGNGTMPVNGVAYCPMHAPGITSERREWLIRGGEGKGGKKRPEMSRVSLRSQQDVVELMENLALWVLRGNVPSRDAAVVVAAVREARTANSENIDRRVRDLEKALKKAGK